MDDELEEEFASLFGDKYQSWKLESEHAERIAEKSSPNKLDNMLQVLGSEGTRVDDDGQFTLNSAKAVEKLASYRLPDFNEAIAPLLGSAAASGATWVDFEWRSSGFVFSHDGRAFKEAQLQRLFEQLLSSTAEPASKEFALALNTLIASKPKKFVYESWHQDRGFRFELTGGHKLTPLTEPPDDWSGHRLVFKSGEQSLAKAEQASEILIQRCATPPLSVKWNGKKLVGIDSQPILSYFLWEHPDHPVGKLHLNPAHGLVEASPGDFSLLLSIGPKVGFTCLVNGSSYAFPLENPIPHASALMVNNKAKRDILLQTLQNKEDWQISKSQLDIAIHRLVNFTKQRQETADRSETKQHFSAAIRLAPQLFSGKSTQLASYQTSDGRWVTRSEVQGRGKILYTNRIWPHPLRDGRTVLILSDQERETFIECECADQLLATSQTYFEKKKQWEAQQTSKMVTPTGKNAVSEKLTTLDGQIGLLSDPYQTGLIYPYCEGRPLPPTPWQALPRGCWLMIDHPDFEVNDTWTEVSFDGLQNKLDAILMKDLTDFYLALLKKSPKQNPFLLSFVLHLKHNDRPWYNVLARIAFRKKGLSGMLGRTRVLTLEQRYADCPDVGNSKVKSFGESALGGRLAELLKILTQGLVVSKTERALLTELARVEQL